MINTQNVKPINRNTHYDLTMRPKFRNKFDSTHICSQRIDEDPKKELVNWYPMGDKLNTINVFQPQRTL